MAFVCEEPDCGRSFEKPQGLFMHKKRAHENWGGSPSKRVTCPDCGQLVSVSYMARHVSVYHTPEGELVPLPPVRKRKTNNVTPAFKVMPFVVLEDTNGGLWIAEKIR